MLGKLPMRSAVPPAPCAAVISPRFLFIAGQYAPSTIRRQSHGGLRGAVVVRSGRLDPYITATARAIFYERDDMC